jgi:hypothetical protein
VTLAEMLKPRGFTTGAIVSTFVLDRQFGVSQGFDSYDDRFQAVHKIGDLSERKGDETTRVAKEWLDAHKERPFFFFVHFYDPHEPYEPPEPFASQWKEQPYEGEIGPQCLGRESRRASAEVGTIEAGIGIDPACKKARAQRTKGHKTDSQVLTGCEDAIFLDVPGPE